MNKIRLLGVIFVFLSFSVLLLVDWLNILHRYQSDCDGKRLRTSRDDNGDSAAKGEGEPSSAKATDLNKAELPKQDYIHVRARRGQATDSHSLAERVCLSRFHLADRFFRIVSQVIRLYFIPYWYRTCFKNYTPRFLDKTGHQTLFFQGVT